MAIELDQTAFDIDGVVVDIVEPILRLLEDRHGIGGFAVDDIIAFDLEEALGIPRPVIDDVVDVLQETPLEAGVRLYPGASRVLGELAAQNPVLFVTARDNADATRDWLGALLSDIPPDRNDVIATGDPMTKLHYLLERERTVFFDDNLDTCRQLDRAGLSAYVFDQPWNRRDGSLSRVSGWGEIARLFGLDGD